MGVRISGNLIQIPQGDTGSVKFVFEEGTAAEKDRAVFTLVRHGGPVIMRKILTPNLGDHAFHMMFVHDDTANLRPDTYEWSLRVVRGAVFDANGRLMSVQGQHTAVLSGRMAVLRVAGGAK
ncbi:MAG: hypothetical protein IJ418_12175 [Clostridia bacterium]|nr:hypothetical protein [Clostridia bacterium]